MIARPSLALFISSHFALNPQQQQKKKKKNKNNNDDHVSTFDKLGCEVKPQFQFQVDTWAAHNSTVSSEIRESKMIIKALAIVSLCLASIQASKVGAPQLPKKHLVCYYDSASFVKEGGYIPHGFTWYYLLCNILCSLKYYITSSGSC